MGTVPRRLLNQAFYRECDGSVFLVVTNLPLLYRMYSRNISFALSRSREMVRMQRRSDAAITLANYV